MTTAKVNLGAAAVSRMLWTSLNCLQSDQRVARNPSGVLCDPTPPAILQFPRRLVSEVRDLENEYEPV